jgi:hypothetical protein
MELDTRSDRHWSANGGDTAVSRPANHSGIRGERVGNRFEDAVGSQRIAKEGGGGEVMDGEEEEEYRKNVAKWMAKAKEGPRTGTLQSSQPSIHQVIKRPVQ